MDWLRIPCPNANKPWDNFFDAVAMSRYGVVNHVMSHRGVVGAAIATAASIEARLSLSGAHNFSTSSTIEENGMGLLRLARNANKPLNRRSRVGRGCAAVTVVTVVTIESHSQMCKQLK